MADYYCQLSVSLPRPAVTVSEAETDQRIETWAESVNAEINEHLELEEWDHPLIGATIEVVDDFTAAGQVRAVWVYADGEGSIDACLEVTRRYLDDFAIEGGVQVTWAEWCSRPQIGAAGGGAAIVTRTEILTCNPLEGLLKDAAEAGVEILN